MAPFTLPATGTALKWKVSTPVMTVAIPSGNYLVHGFDFVSKTAIGARLRIPQIGFWPATIPRRTEAEPMHPFCKSFYPEGIPYAHKSGTIDIQVEYCCDLNETPAGCTLFLEYLGPFSG